MGEPTRVGLGLNRGACRGYHSYGLVGESKARQERRQRAQESKIASTISWLLNHAGDEAGLDLQPDGLVPVHELLKHPLLSGVDILMVEKVINTNKDYRFQLIYRVGGARRAASPSGQDGTANKCWWIRSRKGHSIGGVRTDFKRMLSPHQAAMAVKWATPEQWEHIQHHGLQKSEGDDYIRFLQSTDLSWRYTQVSDPLITPPSADLLLPKPSPSSPHSELHRSILITLDLPKALSGGLTFYFDNFLPAHLRRRFSARTQSAFLPMLVTKGNALGLIGKEFFKKVECVDMAVRKVPMALGLETSKAQEEPATERETEVLQAHPALEVNEEVGVPDVPSILISQQASASSASTSLEAQAPAANPSEASSSSSTSETTLSPAPSPLVSASPEPDPSTSSPPTPTHAPSRTLESDSTAPSSTSSPIPETSSSSPSTSTSSLSSLPAFTSESEENSKPTAAASTSAQPASFSSHQRSPPAFHPPPTQQTSSRHHQLDRQQNSNAYVPPPTNWRKEHSGSREAVAVDSSGRRMDSVGSERAMLRCAPPGYLVG